MEKKTYFMIPAHDSRCTILSFLFHAQNGGAHEHEPGHESSPQICHCLLFEAASNHKSRIVFLSLSESQTTTTADPEERAFTHSFINSHDRQAPKYQKRKTTFLILSFFLFPLVRFPFFALWVGCLSWILDSRTRVRKELL